MLFFVHNTLTLQLGFHSPFTYLVYTLQAYVGFLFFYNLNFNGALILSVPIQVVGSHFTCICLVYTLQSHVCISSIEKNNFSWGLALSLSNKVSGFHSPCPYLVYSIQAYVGFEFFFFNLLFSCGFSYSHSPTRI